MRKSLYFFVSMSIVSMSLISCVEVAPAKKQKGSDKPFEKNGYYSKIGYSPSARWTNVKEYYYSFTSSEERCTISKKFSRQADYCMSLQDASFNNNCNRDERKKLFTIECGKDFSDVNIPGDWKAFGDDFKLQQKCSTADSGVTHFDVKEEFCSFIKNEDLHKSCLWGDRKNKFNSLNCEGDFSPKPEYPGVVNSDDLLSIPVVKELKDAGIEVAMYKYNITAFHKKEEIDGTAELAIIHFFQNLEAAKEELKLRKTDITTINISDNAAYLSWNKTISFNYLMSKESIVKYLKLVDKKIQKEKMIGIKHEDTDGSGLAQKNEFQPLEMFLGFVDRNSQELIKVKNVVKRISFKENQTDFKSDRTLILNSENPDQALQEMLPSLTNPSILKLYNWAASKQVRVGDGEYEFDLPLNLDKLAPMASLLMKSEPELNNLVQKNMLSAIIINVRSVSYTAYSSGTKTLSMNTNLLNSKETEKDIATLSQLANLQADLGVPISINLIQGDYYYNGGGSYLDRNFYKAFKDLVSLKNDIKSAIENITMVELGSVSYYNSTDKRLGIGFTSTLSESKEAIKKSKIRTDL